MMILLRVLLLGALLWLGWMIWRQWRGPAPSDPPERLEKMVRCDLCGEYVPKRSAIEVDGRYTCQKHRPDSEA